MQIYLAKITSKNGDVFHPCFMRCQAQILPKFKLRFAVIRLVSNKAIQSNNVQPNTLRGTVMKSTISISTIALSFAFGLPLIANAQSRDVNEAALGGTGNTQVQAEIWVDNWFALSVNGTPLHEDSTPYNTERSFNAERISFTADLPMTVAFEFRDFMENQTGLEYIGTNRQQMGDGGAIAQFYNVSTGQLLGATDARWRCLAVQHAPVQTSCANESNPQVGNGACAAQTTDAPDNWTSAGFDDSEWPEATIHSASTVRPKHGYDAVNWNASANLIWGDDLERDNVVLCRATFE